MNPLARPFAALITARLALMLPGLRCAPSAMFVTLPWDRPLNLIAAYLTGPATHTLVKLAFIAAAALYVITGNSNYGVRQLARAGLGLTFALEAVRLMNWLLEVASEF